MPAVMSVLSGTGTLAVAYRLTGLPLSGLNCLLVETRAQKDCDRGRDMDLAGEGVGCSRWWEINGETVETVSDFILGGPKSLQLMILMGICFMTQGTQLGAL